MFRYSTRVVSTIQRVSIKTGNVRRALATATQTQTQMQTQTASATVNSNENGNQDILPHAADAPRYVLTTLRSFPSLEPHSIMPVAIDFLGSPLRRDILWKAVIMEADNARVGASNPPGRGEHKYSRRKLFKQKGTGRARVGDANSPIRNNGAVAHARTAPNDFSTELPFKVYANAYRTALSDYYRNDKLFIIGGEEGPRLPTDNLNLEIITDQKQATEHFINKHELKNLNLLFIPNDLSNCHNLEKSIRTLNKKRIKILSKEEVEVRDLLKANRIYIEKEALEFFAKEFAEELV
ncbi:hypothetical protein PACTADRAFT_48582 [Pachysolen tannophilus NRRL Y-2460]|uniref:Large ribosomal subunit protein uL4m n=1 Tax=Pachysolen tannophilus NRRL Y-2460 TaxID=669874 RepID=A0A1E4TYE4_PACTA|nr:hypothetical protein PACTADRAFT_48582 [Pachysolen tannophilus NRRL Y-2460]